MRAHTLLRPIQRRFRRRRMAKFVELFGIGDGTRVLDLGGTPFNWRLISSRPQVLMVNLEGKPSAESNLTLVNGDATALSYPDGAFDICYSNSVIEHVTDPDARRRFAAEVRRLAPAYYVQTPNRNFPLEMHVFGLFFHWLPRAWQPVFMRWGSLWGLLGRPGPDAVRRMLDDFRLLDERELRALFPDAEIHRERFLFMTKSLTAIRRAPGAAVAGDCEAKKRRPNSALGHRVADAIGSDRSISKRGAGADLPPT